MNSIETTGKTVDEAIEEGLKRLGVDRENVSIEVIEEPNKGFFGIIGAKNAKVRLEKKPDVEKLAKEFLYETCEKMGINVKVDFEQKEDYYYFYLSGENMGVIIGRRGETLDSLQYLTNLYVNKRLHSIGRRAKIILDAEHYREKRENTLIRLAHKVSKKVKKSGSKVVLEPMNPHERRIIHTTLQNDKEVKTFSEGDEPYRKVIVEPVENRGD